MESMAASIPRPAILLLSGFLLAALLPSFAAEAAETRTDRAERALFEKYDPLSRRVTLSLSAGVWIPGPGEAGVDAPAPPPLTADRPAPDYADAFRAGFAGGIEASYKFSPAAAAVVRGDFGLLPGREATEGYLGRVRYGELRCLALGFGLRLSAPLNLPSDLWFRSGIAPRNHGFEPSLCAHFGLAYRDRVTMNPLGGYWKASTVFTAGLSLGMEFGLSAFGIFFETGVRYVSEPSETIWLAEADATVLFLFRAGVRLYL
jgi:hypothetical protein